MLPVKFPGKQTVRLRAESQRPTSEQGKATRLGGELGLGAVQRGFRSRGGRAESAL